jgi:DNA replication protein DnaC
LFICYFLKRTFDRDLSKEQEYIQRFNKLFQEKFKNLIEKAVEKKHIFKYQNDLIQEVIHHSNQCITLASKMPAFHEMFSCLAEYLNDDQNRSPFILTGTSGAGKSSLMAFVAIQVIHMNFLNILNILLSKDKEN